MKGKLVLLVMIGVLFLTFSPQEVNACEIEFEVIKGKKEVYNAGDTIVVKVNVSLTHRSCPVAIKKTKFKLKGMRVIKSTGWKQLSTMEYERKLKIVITDTGGKKVSLTAIRECEKDGGFGSLKLETLPVE